MLEIQGLHAGYGRVPVLTGIDLAVARGDFLGILGHNGMGKTTLLRTLMGFLPASAGEIRFQGEPVTRLKPHQRSRRRIGYVPQGREIFPALSVAENLRVGCRLSATGERSRIAAVLRLFPRLERLLDRQGGALSGGEQQLLALARCLCGAPDLILLDEPTEGIQPSIVEEMAETLDRLKRELSLTVVLVEQNLDFIGAVASRIAILEKGRIVREAPPDAVRNPAILNEYVGL
jgi:urea ABC transporter ATP-binding protein UrtE